MNAQAQPAGNTATPPSFLLRVKGFALPNAEATPRQHSNTPEPVAGVAKALPPPVATPEAPNDAAGDPCCYVADPMNKPGYWSGFQWRDFNVRIEPATPRREWPKPPPWTQAELDAVADLVDKWPLAPSTKREV